MNDRLDFGYLLKDTRAKVYLLWAFLAGGGFLATHYHQQPNINLAWTIIALLGLGYMHKVMPMRATKFKQIWLAWFVPILFGLVVSILVFKVPAWTGLINYLGGFWLFVMAVGYFWNGLVDAPARWYYICGALNVVAGLAVFLNEPLVSGQYLLAAIISAWSMLNLFIFRTVSS